MNWMADYEQDCTHDSTYGVAVHQALDSLSVRLDSSETLRHITPQDLPRLRGATYR